MRAGTHTRLRNSQVVSIIASAGVRLTDIDGLARRDTHFLNKHMFFFNHEVFLLNELNETLYKKT